MSGSGLMLRHYPAKPGGHKHSGSKDVMVFVCHESLQGKVIKSVTRLYGLGPLKVSQQLFKVCKSQALL